MRTVLSCAIALLLALAAVPPRALAEVNVFACEPEWAALAAEVGGNHVAAFSATTAGQDPHHIRARPSLIARIRRADLVFCSGAGLEAGWLPVLMRRGAPAGVQPGRPGHLMAADQVALLERPATVDRSQGDVHPEGNPHVHLDPRNILKIASALAGRLAAIDPANAAAYAAQAKDFEARWSAALAGWQRRAGALGGMPVILHHKSWTYLVHWIGLREVATLEPKPGLPPTVSHLEELLRRTRAEPVKAILRTPYDPAEASAWLSARTGIPALLLPYTVGGDEGTTDLFALFERTLAALEKANR